LVRSSEFAAAFKENKHGFAALRSVAIGTKRQFIAMQQVALGRKADTIASRLPLSIA
jgi:hypothetical protein